MPDTADIKATELRLVDIFSDSYLFEIPPYQRPYAWTTEEVNDLFDDLLYAMKAPGNVDDLPPYFLGSIVIIQDSRSSSTASIVDGQQRITTLTILFCVLRELCSDSQDQNTLDKYIREDSDRFAGIEGEFRLTVRSRDKDFFKSNIQERGVLESFLKSSPTELRDSRKRMFENSEYLWNKVSELGQQRRDKLVSFLLQRCYLVVVSTTDMSSAYRIFSVMNDRGLDLSPTDILKSEIIGAMDKDKDSYTQKWEDIEEDLGRDSFRELFAHIRMIYMKDKARGTLNDEFRAGVLDKLYDEVFIDDVLEPFTDAYNAVARTAYEGPKSEKINLYLNHLGRLDNSDWIPPAMAFYDRNKGDGGLLLQFVRHLERLAYGMFIIRANVTERINRYARLLSAIEQGDELFFDDAPLQLTSDERSKVVSNLNGDIYLSKRVRMPLLLRLDGLLAAAGATYDHSIVTVEHVLPQNPQSESEWCSWFSDSAERDYWTHRIANLVLLSRRKNSRAGNYDFERKKQVYFQRNGITPFVLTSQVIDEGEWTPDVLERRQKQLINVLRSEWSLA